MKKLIGNLFKRFTGHWGGLAIVLILGIILGYMMRGGPADTHGNDTEITTAIDKTPPAEEKKPTWWTCSMHPQIRLPKPGLCPICSMKLIPLVKDDSGNAGLRELTVSENAEKLMEIETVPVERKFVEAEIRMVGKIDYDEIRMKYITAWIPGRLDRLFVDYTGVPVQKGDHMVYLYSPELLSAQEELIQALEAVKNLKDSDYDLVRRSSRANVEAVREKLRLWGLLPEQIKEIETSGHPSDHMTIYAPAGGIVIHKNAQEGMYVKTGTRIYTIADLTRVWVRLDAYESDLSWLRYGQKVEFTTEAYPGETFEGTIAFIDPVLTQNTRTVKVRVNASNTEMKLKPGMFVRAVAKARVAAGGRIMDPDMKGKWICPMHPDVVKDSAGDCDICGMPLVGTESLGFVGREPDETDKPLVIPESAALVTGTRAIVYVQVPKAEKPTFEGREIVLGPHAGKFYIVRNGLEEGELVVTNGNFKIDAELQIKAKPSMMTPEGGGAEGGHRHGGMKTDRKNTMGATLDLPGLVRTQLFELLTLAHHAIKAAAAGDVTQAAAAFDTLDQKIKAIRKDGLHGHAGMVWKEYSMLLSNDCIEGKDMNEPADLERLSDTLEMHVESLQSQLGLTSEEEKRAMPVIGETFLKRLQGVLDAYLTMQRALSDDDANGAAGAAKKALKALSSVDMNLLTGEDHTAWMKHGQALKKILIEANDAKGIEPIREAFALLSEQMMATLERFGNTGQGALYQFLCPMAFDNRGATWLQDHDDTLNPYFGDAMLHCGEVIKVLPGKKGEADMKGKADMEGAAGNKEESGMKGETGKKKEAGMTEGGGREHE